MNGSEWIAVVAAAVVAWVPAGAQERTSRDVLLTAPFATARLNLFHAALEVPDFEPAHTLDAGAFLVRLRTTHARSDTDRTRRGFKSDFDGMFHEWVALEASWGIVERLEVGVRGVYGGWDEHMDRFEILDGQGDSLVRGEEATITHTGATHRQNDLSVVRARAKLLLVDSAALGFDLAILGSVKFPTGRARNLTSAGTTDIAATALASLPFDWGAIHAALGGTFPLGSQNLFERSAGIDLNPFIHGAVGVTWAPASFFATGVQLEANSSAFNDVSFLDDPAFNVTAGVRFLLGDFFIEGATGTGLDWSSSYEYLFSLSAGYVF